MLDIEGDQGFSVEAGPVSSRARSRSRNFCSFPVEVFGKGPKMTVFGALKCAKRSRQKSMISCSVAEAPSFSVTKARVSRPIFRWVARLRRPPAPPDGDKAPPQPQWWKCFPPRK